MNKNQYEEGVICIGGGTKSDETWVIKPEEDDLWPLK